MSGLRSAPLATAPAEQSRSWLVMFHVVGFCVGAGAAALVVHHLARLGPGLVSGAPLVHDVLALEPGAAAEALGSGSPVLPMAVLACATVGAGTLLCAAVVAPWPHHRRAAHRLTTTGLWVVLVVCLVSMLPLAGNPFGLSWQPPVGPTGFAWHPVPKTLAVAAAAGLLLSAITSHPDRSEPVQRAAAD